MSKQEEQGSDLTIRSLKIDEINTFRKWIHEDVGWNLGNELQWKTFLSNDSGGWLIGENQQYGIIGNILGMIIDEKRALIGLFVIKKELRFKGYGKLLWNALMAHLASRTLALYSVDYRIDGYKKLGFGEPTFVVHIFDTTLKDVKAKAVCEDDTQKGHDSAYDIIDLRSDLGQGLFNDLVAYDTTIHTVQRASYLEMCLKDKANTISIIGALSKSGQIIGYAMVVKRYLGYAMTPLYADDAQIATFLLHAGIGKIPNATGGGTAFELVSPVKYLGISKCCGRNNLSEEAVGEIMNYWNNHLKLWIGSNVWNNKAFSHVEIHTELYRMYKLASDVDKNTNVNEIHFELLPHILDHPSKPDEKSCKKQNSGTNVLGINFIPLYKVYSVSSLEAYWI